MAPPSGKPREGRRGSRPGPPRAQLHKSSAFAAIGCPMATAGSSPDLDERCRNRWTPTRACRYFYRSRRPPMRTISKTLSLLAFLAGTAVLHADAPKADAPQTTSNAEITTGAAGIKSKIQDDYQHTLY